MERDFVKKLNEIGSKIGYPFAYLKDGKILKVDDDYQGDDSVLVVFARIPDRLLDNKSSKRWNKSLSKVTEGKTFVGYAKGMVCRDEKYWPKLRENDMLWKQLFPKHENVNIANISLTRKEEEFLILRARWRIVYNYFKYHDVSVFAARDLIRRNDDLLLLHINDVYGVYPIVLQEVIVYQMSDERFAQFIENWVVLGNKAFHSEAEIALIKQHSVEKLKVYFEHFQLSKLAEKVLFDLGDVNYFEAYVKKHKLSYVVEKMLKNSSKTELIEIYEKYVK